MPNLYCLVVQRVEANIKSLQEDLLQSSDIAQAVGYRKNACTHTKS